MTPWTRIPAKGAPLIAAITSAIPEIVTERLVLRVPRMDDWAVLEPIYTSERAVYIGGPMSAEEAWLDFNQLVAGWVLRGHGALTICAKDTGDVLGLVLLGHEFGDPEPELGWLLTAEAEGHGYATEAAAAVVDLGRDIYGTHFVSYIADGNDASVRVATRLGAVHDGAHPLDASVAIYRYSDKGPLQ